jgi:hypothetical protein
VGVLFGDPKSKRNKYIFSFNKKPLHLQDKLNEQEILVNILSVLISMVVFRGSSRRATFFSTYGYPTSVDKLKVGRSEI